MEGEQQIWGGGVGILNGEQRVRGMVVGDVGAGLEEGSQSLGELRLSEGRSRCEAAGRLMLLFKREEESTALLLELSVESSIAIDDRISQP
ncbi:uncharacterized protein A4U43_C03F990 [Asparagus officinalis]|uniref:Uncharacterized protein n=1 Tax=Asparagus officinalis TaxID=4686 RepID=A0A5P1F6B1_ASPOF|nr:uncharacterized protein A4U43_C03F990 [Asparagus officinalis]